LIRTRLLAGEFDFDIQSATVRNAVAPDIGLAMFSHMDDGSVFGVELAYRVIDSVTAVLT
jgi:hypothetical protein